MKVCKRGAGQLLDVSSAEGAASSSDQLAEDMAFVGLSLFPFFLFDPAEPDARAAFAAVAELDVAAMAESWPSVDVDDAMRCLLEMREDCRTRGLDSLSRDYRWLFVGPNRLQAPPWGSVYTDKDGVVFGESTLALRSWMRGHGIVRHEDMEVPDDHIGLMLSMAAWIAEHRPMLVREYVEKHMLTWTDHYLAQLEQAAEKGFYAALAHLTKLSLDGVHRMHALAVEYPTYYR